MLDAHLRLSKEKPLTLCFYLATECWAHTDSMISGASTLGAGFASPTEVMSTLLEKARSHQRRWNKFSVRVDSHQRSGTPLWLMELVNDPIQKQLKSLKMGVHLDPLASADNRIPPLLNLTPYRGLETLQITGPFVVSTNSAERGFPPPFFPSLRVLRIECYDASSLQALWKILQESPSLEEAHLWMELPFPSILSTISLDNLKFLYFSARLFEIGMGVLGRMRLPSLVRLELNNLPVWDQCLRRLAHVLPSCNAPLEKCSLYVYNVETSFRPESFGAVFKSMMQLEQLELAWVKSTPNRSLPASVHRAFASILRKERGTFLPNLTRLSVDTDVHDMITNPSSAACLSDLIIACRNKFQGSAHRFHCGITSSMAVSEEDSVSFETMLLGDSLIGECIAAENFEVLVKFR